MKALLADLGLNDWLLLAVCVGAAIAGLLVTWPT